MAKGFILEHFNSPFNGDDCVAILTLNSQNRKIGIGVPQVWILNAEISPIDAVNSGRDESICGDCIHRKQADGSRSCYVNIGQAPLSIWRAYKANKYKLLWQYSELEHAVQGRTIRWGAYGDPAILSHDLVDYLNRCAANHTGYTHQWRHDFAQPFKGVFQASVDTAQEFIEASRMGWKTFNVLAKSRDQESLSQTPGIQCPNAINPNITCSACHLCNGSSQHIWITAHGNGAKHVHN